MSPKRRMKSAQGSLQPEFVAASVDHSGDEMDNRDDDLQFGNVEPGEVGMWPHCVCLHAISSLLSSEILMTELSMFCSPAYAATG